MAKIIRQPALIKAEGQPVKIINEYFGHVNSNDKKLSIAHMKSPEGWTEPGQKPGFAEYTVVLKGKLHIELEDRELDIEAGQGICTEAGEWVRYSSPAVGGAEYIAICLPAFTPGIVNRDS